LETPHPCQIGPEATKLCLLLLCYSLFLISFSAFDSDA